ncbi:His/Gly/Thr/Pro-type tRNA ligase C-terminal domain-containing protein, partial [Escherichia coli]|nr:His/Gly/Thr/Pro-type tRNA ligase C-terminal domain-containing protein [Escherichia coli]
ERKMFPPEIELAAPADVLITLFSKDTVRESLRPASDLRAAGIRVTVYPAPDKTGTQINSADQINVPIVLILGESALSEQTVALKQLGQ